MTFRIHLILKMLPSLCGFVLAQPALAQTVPNLPEQLPPFRETPPNPPLQPAPSPPILPPRQDLPAPLSPNQEQSLTISQFLLQGNTVFSDSKLKTLLTPYLNQTLTPDQLKEVALKIVKIYQDGGYPLAYVTYPIELNQRLNPNAAVITLRITEGEIKEVIFEGNGRHQAYMRRKLKPHTGRPFNIRRLEQDLRFLASDPLAQQLSVTVQPGLPGEANLLVNFIGNRAEQLLASTNNYRSPASGSLEQRVDFNHLNVGGIGDTLQLNFRNTSGSKAFQVNYEIPLNPQDTRFTLGYTLSRSSIVEEPFKILELNTSFQNLDISLSHPLWRRATTNHTQELTAGITGTWQNSESTLLGERFPVYPGADDQGQTRLRALRLFQTFAHQGTKQSLFSKSEFSFGLGGLFGGTLNPEGIPDNNYSSWQGQLVYLRRFGKLQLVSRSRLQLTTDVLLPTEQFSLGGANSIRGYRNDLTVSDSGFNTSFELQIPVYSGRRGQFSVIPFIDAGYGFNTQDPQPSQSPLASAGLGLNYIFNNRLSANFYVGFPLSSGSGDRSRWLDYIGFAIRSKLF
jgi:hemolysin activation/secretion protein